jgi:hypothetical protein
MPEQKLNLFQFPALRAAQLRRRPLQIVRRQLADPDLCFVLTHELGKDALTERAVWQWLW